MNKKTISVILATRGRLKYLIEALDSLIDKCSDLEKIEILIKVDDDDLETIEGLKSYKNFDLIKVIISDRKKGYASLNEFYNELYEKSVGDFIFCMNDDATVETYNWDKLIEPYLGQFVCLHHNPAYPHEYTWTFPIVSKKILDVIGCVSKSVFYDGYLLFMLENLELFRQIDLSIHHFLLEDDTTKKKSEIIENWHRTEWEYDTKRPLMLDDRNKIINHLKTISNLDKI
jgi:glycosyltransferase involved in cell wall biosynthesis